MPKLAVDRPRDDNTGIDTDNLPVNNEEDNRLAREQGIGGGLHLDLNLRESAVN